MSVFRITTKGGSVYRLLVHDTVRDKSNARIIPLEKGKIKGEVAGICVEIRDIDDFKTPKGYIIQEKDIKTGCMIWTIDFARTSTIASFEKE